MVHLARKAWTDEALRELAAPGQRLGQIAELFAFGAFQPEKAADVPDRRARCDRDVVSTPRAPLGLVPRAPPDLRFDEKTWIGSIRFLVVRG